MPQIVKDLIAMVVYLTFFAVGQVIEWGGFVAAFGVPIWIANRFSHAAGDAPLAIGAGVGLVCVFLWYNRLQAGLNKRIDEKINELSAKTTSALGARDGLDPAAMAKYLATKSDPTKR